MAETTAISWCDATWNPWRGCHKVSPGCDNCYMYTQESWRGRNPAVVVRSKTTFDDPLRWKEPAFVFTCSLSDFFIREADDWREEAWDIIRRTPHLTYLVLTKRIDRAERWLKQHQPEPLPNVWLGVSIESQAFAVRLDPLFRTPAAKRFVSAEPLLEPLRLGAWLHCAECHEPPTHRPFHHPGASSHAWGTMVDWLIVGGESGPGHRSMDMAWLDSVVAQCFDAGIPVWVKQDSGPRPGRQGRIPDSLWLQQRPAPAPLPAGRLL